MFSYMMKKLLIVIKPLQSMAYLNKILLFLQWMSDMNFSSTCTMDSLEFVLCSTCIHFTAYWCNRNLFADVVSP